MKVLLSRGFVWFSFLVTLLPHRVSRRHVTHDRYLRHPLGDFLPLLMKLLNP